METNASNQGRPTLNPEAYSLGEGYDAPGYRGRRHCGVQCPLLAQLKLMETPTQTDEELVERIKAGDQDASFLLLIKHYRYILKKILEITQANWFSEDILQAGAVGMFEAAKRFDPSKGFKFLTYAHSWILKYIYIEVRNELLPMGGMYIGRDAKELLFNYIKCLLANMDDDKICETLKISKKKLIELKILNVTAARVRSLDAGTVSPDGEEDPEPYNILGIPTTPSPEDDVVNNSLVEFIETSINELAETNPKLAEFLNLELGMNDRVESTKTEICELLEITRQEYSKLQREGNKYLRTRLISNGWYQDQN